MSRVMLVAAVTLLIVVPAQAQESFVDFEQPTYVLGSLDGQAGGGVSWQQWEPGSDASVAVPGYNSDQSGRWDVKDLGTDSDGDDMLGFFDNGQASVFSASGMAFVHMEPNRPNGTSRTANFFVSDAGFAGSAIRWGENGNIWYWGGGANYVWDTGVPIIYDQWVSFQLDIDYGNNQVTVYYNGAQVAQNTLTGVGSGYADQLDIWLDTVALADNPSPSDYMMFDDICITPEPTTLSVLLLGGLALLRRR
jgi:hypothetical protein